LTDLSGVRDTVAAHEIINRFLAVFGDFALYLPGIVLLGVLIAMKIARGRRLALRWAPIPAHGLRVGRLGDPAARHRRPAERARGGAGGGRRGPRRRSRPPADDRIALSIGAGLYEELLFRLLRSAPGPS
jgi:hypothetical protein